MKKLYEVEVRAVAYVLAETREKAEEVAAASLHSNLGDVIISIPITTPARPIRGGWTLGDLVYGAGEEEVTLGDALMATRGTNDQR